MYRKLPSRHTTLIQRRYNVKLNRRCFNAVCPLGTGRDREDDKSPIKSATWQMSCGISMFCIRRVYGRTMTFLVRLHKCIQWVQLFSFVIGYSFSQHYPFWHHIFNKKTTIRSTKNSVISIHSRMYQNLIQNLGSPCKPLVGAYFSPVRWFAMHKLNWLAMAHETTEGNM